MSLIAICGDPHYKVSNRESAIKLCERLLTDESLVDDTVIMGDLNDTHAVLRSEVMAIWCQYFSKIKKTNFVLVGNHDQAKAGSPVHGLEAFKAFENVTVYDEPFRSDKFAFIPYMKSPADFAKAAELVKGAEILFCHQTFQGCQYENGFYAPHADAVDAAVVAHFKLVISGHIHLRQTFGNIYYVGTPFQHSFNDVGQVKGIHILDTDTLKLRFIPLDDFPQYHQIGGDIKMVEAQLDQKFKPNDHLKIVLKDTKDEISKFKKLTLPKLRKKTNVILDARSIDKERVIVPQIKDGLTPEKMLAEYVQNIMKTNLDREKILELANKFMRP